MIRTGFLEVSPVVLSANWVLRVPVKASRFAMAPEPVIQSDSSDFSWIIWSEDYRGHLVVFRVEISVSLMASAAAYVVVGPRTVVGIVMRAEVVPDILTAVPRFDCVVELVIL